MAWERVLNLSSIPARPDSYALFDSTDNTNLYVFGGGIGGPTHAGMYVYNAPANTLTLLATNTDGRSNGAGCIVGDYMYLLGGEQKDSGGFQVNTKACWRFHIPTNVFSRIADHPPPPSGTHYLWRAGAAPHRIDNQIYVLGMNINTTVARFLRYDIASDSWAELLSPSNYALMSFGVRPIMEIDHGNNRLVCIVQNNYTTHVPQCWTYDITAGTWTHQGDMPGGEGWDFMTGGPHPLIGDQLLFGGGFPQGGQGQWVRTLSMTDFSFGDYGNDFPFDIGLGNGAQYAALWDGVTADHQPYFMPAFYNPDVQWYVIRPGPPGGPKAGWGVLAN